MATRDYPPQFHLAATGPVFIFTNCNGKWLSRASLTKELRSALQGRGLPAATVFPTQFSVLVQLLLQPLQVCLRGLSRYWAAGAQTVMNAT